MSDAAPDVIAAGYDAVYAALPASPTLLRIWRERALSPDYPEGFEPISFLNRADLERMSAELQPASAGTLVDLACGLAGPSLWIARQTGAQVVGVDISPVAVELAAKHAAALGLGDRARFVVAPFTATGLDDGCADACMSVDAIQYAPAKQAVMSEAARLLQPGGRFVFTAFELDRARAAGLPVIGADPVDDYRPLLEAARFSLGTYEETPGWLERLTSAYEAILAAETQLIDEMGSAAWLALSSEVSMTLERRPYRGHVFVVATKQ